MATKKAVNGLKWMFPVLLLICSGLGSFRLTDFRQEQRPEPWTENQLLEPRDLAGIINDPGAKRPVLISVGPGAVIKGSLDMGPASEKKNLDKLRQQLDSLPRNADIVIYCGCCPFEHCPNIRPAFRLLNEMKFTNQKLLNIRHNIKTDWMDKGYPVTLLQTGRTGRQRPVKPA